MTPCCHPRPCDECLEMEKWCLTFEEVEPRERLKCHWELLWIE